MKKIILKGTHRAFPPIVKKLEEGPHAWEIDLRDFWYEMTGPDTQDWSKIWGVSESFWDRHENSIMLAARFNQSNGKVEFCTYRHVDGKVVKYDEPDQIVSVPAHGAIVNVELNIRQGTLYAYFHVGREIMTPPLVRFDNYWLIDPWFGGNRTAPRTIKLNVKKL
jgi:hypothetical protein